MTLANTAWALGHDSLVGRALAVGVAGADHMILEGHTTHRLAKGGLRGSLGAGGGRPGGGANPTGPAPATLAGMQRAVREAALLPLPLLLTLRLHSHQELRERRGYAGYASAFAAALEGGSAEEIGRSAGARVQELTAATLHAAARHLGKGGGPGGGRERPSRADHVCTEGECRAARRTLAAAEKGEAAAREDARWALASSAAERAQVAEASRSAEEAMRAAAGWVQAAVGACEKRAAVGEVCRQLGAAVRRGDGAAAAAAILRLTGPRARVSIPDRMFLGPRGADGAPTLTEGGAATQRALGDAMLALLTAQATPAFAGRRRALVGAAEAQWARALPPVGLGPASAAPTAPEVARALRRLAAAASGRDHWGLRADLLRHGPPELAGALAAVLARLWGGEEPPADWAVGTVGPVAKPKATDPRLLKRWRPVEMLSALRRVGEAWAVRRFQEVKRGIPIASTRRGWGAVARLSPAHALLPRLEVGAARGAVGLLTVEVVGDLANAFANCHPALAYEAATRAGYGPHLTRLAYSLTRGGVKVAAPRLGAPRVGRAGEASLAQGGPLSGPLFALTMEVPLARVAARVAGYGEALFPGGGGGALLAWETAGHGGPWELPPRVLTYVDDVSALPEPSGAGVVRAAAALGEEAARVNQRFGDDSWGVGLQAPRGATAADAAARGAGLWQDILAAVGGGGQPSDIRAAGGVALGGPSLGLRFSHTRSFEASHRAAIAAAAREVYTQGEEGFGPPRLDVRAAALMMEQRAASRLGGCYPLSGAPSQWVGGAYDGLERRMAAVILGCGQLTTVVGGGATARAARERSLSPMAHTALVRRDAGVRPARVAAARAQLRWFGRIWAEPSLYPKGLVDTVAAGCALYAADPRGQVRQRSPTALWLAVAGRAEGGPWRTPAGGWTPGGILARLGATNARDVAAYWRTAAALITRDDSEAWSWEGGAHGADGAFTHRAARALGGGRPPTPHWTATTTHAGAGGGGRGGRAAGHSRHAHGPRDGAAREHPAKVPFGGSGGMDVRAVRGGGERRRPACTDRVPGAARGARGFFCRGARNSGRRGRGRPRTAAVRRAGRHIARSGRSRRGKGVGREPRRRTGDRWGPGGGTEEAARGGAASGRGAARDRGLPGRGCGRGGGSSKRRGRARTDLSCARTQVAAAAPLAVPPLPPHWPQRSLVAGAEGWESGARGRPRGSLV